MEDFFQEGREPLCGHGIEFQLNTTSNKQLLIAFIDGFDWYHGGSDEMIVWIRKNLSVDLPDVNATVCKAIKSASTNRDIVCGELSNSVLALVNG